MTAFRNTRVRFSIFCTSLYWQMSYLLLDLRRALLAHTSRWKCCYSESVKRSIKAMEKALALSHYLEAQGFVSVEGNRLLPHLGNI